VISRITDLAPTATPTDQLQPGYIGSLSSRAGGEAVATAEPFIL